jgi:hypothetical protein
MKEKEYLTGLWAHHFEGKPEESATLIVVDNATRHLVAAMIYRRKGEDEKHLTPATKEEHRELQDSLINANSELFGRPADYGLQEVTSLPYWVTEASEKKYIVGGWGHLFEDDKSERITMVVLDAATETLVAALVQRNRAIEDSFTPATEAEHADLEDSLINANGELFTNPADFGLEVVSELPGWVVCAI